MVLGETGKFPIQISVKTRMVMFWHKLVTCNKQKFSCQFYTLVLGDFAANPDKYKWLTCIKNILDECGL